MGYFTGGLGGSSGGAGSSPVPIGGAGLQEAGPKPTNKQLDDYIAACNNPYAPFKGSLSDFIALTNSPEKLGGVTYSIGMSSVDVKGYTTFKGYYLRKGRPDIYFMNSDGYIRQKFDNPNSNNAQLYYYNDECGYLGDCIKVDDGSILNGLANGPNFKQVDSNHPGKTITKIINGKSSTSIEYNYNTGNYGATNSMAIALKIFIFCASNSNVEWGLQGHTGNNWIVGTIHENDQAPKLESLPEYSINSIIYDAHSHPGTTLQPSGADRYWANEYRKINTNVIIKLFLPKTGAWINY